jgi:hypothetical protein
MVNQNIVLFNEHRYYKIHHKAGIIYSVSNFTANHGMVT